MTDTDRDVGQSDGEAHGFDTEFLDDTSETHAAWFGFVDGLKALTASPTRKESMREPHYYQFGYFAAYVGKLVAAALLGIDIGWPA